MKNRSLLLLVILVALPVLAQKREERPKVHADFHFGSYPASRDAIQLMSNDQARLVLVGFAEGWQFEKLAKTFKASVEDLSRQADLLEDERMAGRRDDYGDSRPAMPIIRERDWIRVKDGLQRHTDEFSKVLQDNWPDVEAFVSSVVTPKSRPKEQVLYETVVSGILFGAMMDAFYEDKTLMPPPPRRGKSGNERFYAWLVEDNPALAGKVKREVRESDGYRIYTVGSELPLPEERPGVDDVRGKGTVYEDAEAVKYRKFAAVFSRDKLLPYFKSHRQEFLNQAKLMSSGRYVAAAEVVAWYYNVMANRIVEDMITSRRVASPEKYYSYAIRIAQ